MNDRDSLVEYTDNEYGFAFQVPADWNPQKLPHPGEAGKVRVLVTSPKGNTVSVIVLEVGKTLSKRDFQSNPQSAQIVDAFIDFTIEQVYKKMSHEVGATRMMVVERQVLQSDLGVKFYINTGHFVRDKLLVNVAGIHAIPFEKEHIITFVMTSVVDPKAKQEHETLTRVFNSFHLVGEKPLD